MKKILTIIALCLACVCAKAQMNPGSMPPGGMKPGKDFKGGQTPKKPGKKLEAEFGLGNKKTNYDNVEKMYIYGINYSPVDSVVYFTDELMLTNVNVEHKTGFLQLRDMYSKQLTDHMNKKGEVNRVSCVVFNKSLDKLNKNFNKTIASYKKRGFLVKSVDQTEFRFNVYKEED